MPPCLLALPGTRPAVDGGAHLVGMNFTAQAINARGQIVGYNGLKYPRTVYTDLNGLWLLGTFDTAGEFRQPRWRASSGQRMARAWSGPGDHLPTICRCG